MSEATENLEWKLALRKQIAAALLTDCQSGIKKLKRGEAGGRTKHLDLRAKSCCRSHGTWGTVLEVCADGRQVDNIADMLTKPLGFSQAQHLCAQIGLELL